MQAMTSGEYDYDITATRQCTQAALIATGGELITLSLTPSEGAKEIVINATIDQYRADRNPSNNI